MCVVKDCENRKGREADYCPYHVRRYAPPPASTLLSRLEVENGADAPLGSSEAGKASSPIASASTAFGPPSPQPLGSPRMAVQDQSLGGNGPDVASVSEAERWQSILNSVLSQNPSKKVGRVILTRNCSVEDVLQSHRTRAYFRRQMSADYRLENLDFWEAVNQVNAHIVYCMRSKKNLDKISVIPALRDHCKNVADTFIGEEANRQILIPQSESERILAALANDDLAVFSRALSDAQEEVTENMRVESFRRFQYSRHWKDMLVNLGRYQLLEIFEVPQHVRPSFDGDSGDQNGDVGQSMTTEEVKQQEVSSRPREGSRIRANAQADIAGDLPTIVQPSDDNSSGVGTASSKEQRETPPASAPARSQYREVDTAKEYAGTGRADLDAPCDDKSAEQVKANTERGDAGEGKKATTGEFKRMEEHDHEEHDEGDGLTSGEEDTDSFEEVPTCGAAGCDLPVATSADGFRGRAFCALHMLRSHTTSSQTRLNRRQTSADLDVIYEDDGTPSLSRRLTRSTSVEHAPDLDLPSMGSTAPSTSPPTSADVKGDAASAKKKKKKKFKFGKSGKGGRPKKYRSQTAAHRSPFLAMGSLRRPLQTAQKLEEDHRYARIRKHKRSSSEADIRRPLDNKRGMSFEPVVSTSNALLATVDVCQSIGAAGSFAARSAPIVSSVDTVRVVRERSTAAATHRYMLLKKLVVSEKHYVDALHTLQNYEEELRMHGPGLGITADVVNAIFLNAGELAAFHRNMLDELEKMRDPIGLATFLYSRRNFLERYDRFLRDYEKAIETASSLSKNADAIVFLGKLQGTPGTQVLVHHIMLPLHRFRFYGSFVRELHDHTRLDDSSYKDCRLLLQYVRGISDTMAEKRRSMASMLQLEAVQRRVRLCPFTIVAAARRLVREGIVMKRSKSLLKSVKPRIVFVFNDILMWTTCNSFKFRGSIDLITARLEVKSDPLGIVVHGTERSLDLSFHTQHSQMDWLRLLNSCIDEAKEMKLEKRKRLHERREEMHRQISDNLHGLYGDNDVRPQSVHRSSTSGIPPSESRGHVPVLPTRDRHASETIFERLVKASHARQASADSATLEQAASQLRKEKDEDDEEDGKEKEHKETKVEKKLRKAKEKEAKKQNKIKAKNAGVSVSRPYNVQHNNHVDVNFEWSGQDLEKTFILAEKLGEGAFGEVYRGVHRTAGFELAIKMIFVPEEDIDKEVQAIKDEVEILKQCSFPNIVSYFGVWGPDSEGRLWILMDLCEVGSVGDLIQLSRTQLNERQIAYIISSTLKSLVYLHAKQIVHRDVKANNILLTRAGDVKLADFGVSKQIQPHSESDKEYGQLIGSPLWMAPESVSGRSADFKSDIWALGITAIEIAEGCPPRAELSVLRVMRAIVNMPPPTLNPACPFWSAAFHDFVALCLKKDPAERPDAIELLGHPFLSRISTNLVIRPVIGKAMMMKKKHLSSRIRGSYDVLQRAQAVNAARQNGEQNHERKVSNGSVILGDSDNTMVMVGSNSGTFADGGDTFIGGSDTFVGGGNSDTFVGGNDTFVGGSNNGSDNTMVANGSSGERIGSWLAGESVDASGTSILSRAALGSGTMKFEKSAVDPINDAPSSQLTIGSFVAAPSFQVNPYLAASSNNLASALDDMDHELATLGSMASDGSVLVNASAGITGSDSALNHWYDDGDVDASAGSLVVHSLAGADLGSCLFMSDSDSD